MKWLMDNSDGVSCPWCGEAHRTLEAVGDMHRGGVQLAQGVRQLRKQARKVKRKVSPYQKEFGRQLKKLKKKHPRTPVTRLMKRAHTATKKARR